MRSTAIALGLWLACGCGGGGGRGDNDDAAPDREDAAPDDPDAATATPMTVTVLDQLGVPILGANVLFVAADGTLVADVFAGADGRATAEMVPGGSATVVLADGGFTAATTFLDLWPDAEVVSQVFIDEQFVPVTVSWPVEGNSNGYRVFTDCPIESGAVVQTTNTSVVLDLRADCANGFSALVVADNNMALAPRTQFATGLSAPTATLAGTYSNIQALPIAVSNIPLDLTGPINVGSTTWLDPALPNTPFLASGSLDGTGAGALTAAAGSGRAIQMSMAAATSFQLRVERLDPTATGYTLDLDGQVLPYPTDAEFDPATRTMSWFVQDPLGATAAVPNVILARVEYTRSPAGMRWDVIAPGSSLTAGAADQQVLTFPDLPGDLEFEPLAGDSVSIDTASLIAVDPAVADDVRGQIQAHRGRLDLFHIDTLTHVALVVAQ